jgi:DNA invertase Pin-like site-specific DNA recombinase
MLSTMRAIGYVRVSTDKQADHGVPLEAQEAKIRAMAVVQGAEIAELIVEGGESAKNLNRPGMERLLALVDQGKIQTVIIAKLDRLTRSVKDLAELLERFQKRGVSLVSVAESLDTGSAAGRLVINIMTAVSQWEREAIGERTRDAMNHKKSNGQRVGNITYGFRLGPDGEHLEPDPRASCAHGYPGPAREALHATRDRYGTERSRSAHAPGIGLAAGARGTDHWATQVGSQVNAWARYARKQSRLRPTSEWRSAQNSS